MRSNIFFSALAVAGLIFLHISPVTRGFAASALQALTPQERAAALLNTLSPEERVGQLFIINFTGTQTEPDTDIYNLIMQYHIGGVMLRADHDNIPAISDAASETQSLIQNIQEVEWLSTQQIITDTASGQDFTPAYIPMFIGISQPGDGAPYDQILSALTTLPNPGAIGATWNPELSEQIGFVAGQELSALGFNLMFGPSLDVLENPKPESSGDLGIQTFGGDPFWVGQMGSAYIQGVHSGSNNRIAVIGTHFPGVGGADRPIEDEVSTVRKSLEQLKQIELAPFFYVTGDAPSPEAVVDGLLISHIRYQGFLGNIRATTRPVSFDEASINEIMNLEPFESWRSKGGIMISDDLGSRAVRRFYDPNGLSFNARLVVRDAFLAGNDILYLGDILDSGDSTVRDTIVRTVEFFTLKYIEDPVFAERVDEAVFRILTKKFEIYKVFNLNEVIPNISDLTLIGNNGQVVADVIRGGTTLISPDIQNLENLLPDAPGLEDRILFITDTKPFQQCSTCPPEESIAADALQQTVLRLYGPESGNQVQRRNLTSFTFTDLDSLLNTSSNGDLEISLRNADWLVVAMQDVTPDRPTSRAIRRLLSERDELIRTKHVVIFAFDAPYFLDATDISKVTALYALYSKTPQAIEIAAQILLKEFAPSFGASPVSVAGTGYDLISATSPDPSQEIRVLLKSPAPEPPQEETNQDSPTPIEIDLSKQILLETSIILDYNGNAVPDGTPIQFIYNLNGIDTLSPIIITTGGIARTSYTLDAPGTMRIGLLTEPGALVDELEINIQAPEDFTPPAPTSEASPAITESPEPTPGPTEQAQPEPGPEIIESRTETDFIDWVIAFLVSLFVGMIAYRIGSVFGLSRWSIRWGLSSAIGGLLTYLYLSMGLWGTTTVITAGRTGMVWIILAGAFAGWLISAIWYGFSRLNAATNENTDPPSFPITQKN